MITKLATAMLVLSLPGTAFAQGNSCIPRQDAEAAMLFALPRAMEAARQACGKTLPPDAFLNTGAEAYTARLKAEHPDSWRAVSTVMARFAGSDFPPGLTPETAAAFAGEMLTGIVSKDIKPETCPLVNQLASDFAAMPEDRLARATLTLVELTQKPSKKKNAVTLCPATPS